METKIIVTCSTNWADEMDIVGQAIFENDEWSALENALKEYKNSIELCIGTNEELTFENGQDFLDCCDVDEILKEHAEVVEQYAILDSFEIFGKVACIFLEGSDCEG